jgi:hypothetical protein
VESTQPNTCYRQHPSATMISRRID